MRIGGRVFPQKITSSSTPHFLWKRMLMNFGMMGGCLV